MLGVFVLLIVVVVGLQVSGTVDLTTIIPGFKQPTSDAIDPGIAKKAPKTSSRASIQGAETSGTATSGSVVAFDDPSITEAPEMPIEIDEGPDPEVVFQERFDKAKGLIDERRWAEARAYLEPMMAQKPDHLPLNEAMMKVYKGLGLNDRYAETKIKVKSLKKLAKENP